MSFLNWRRGKKGLVGIEVGPASLGIAVAAANGKFILLDHTDASPAQWTEVIQNWVRKNHLEHMACNLVLHPDSYSTQLIERPSVEPDELVDAVRWKIKDTLDFSIDDAVLDVYEYPEDALRGKPALTNVVVARKTFIIELIKLVNDSQLNLKSIDVTELALRNLVQPLAEQGQAVALVLMRETSGMILLVKDGMVYFSRRLYADMQGLAEPALGGKIGQQLALEVQRSMDYFESQMGQKAPRALLVSAAVNETELSAHLSDILGVDVLAIPENRLGVSEDQVAGSEYFVACGGAMRSRATASPRVAA